MNEKLTAVREAVITANLNGNKSTIDTRYESYKINLENVLVAIRKKESIFIYQKSVSNLLFTNFNSEEFSSDQTKKEWNFGKSLDDQPQETIDFLYELLVVK